MQRIRVYLVDDHAMVREGLANMLAMQSGFEVVGQAGGGEQLLAEVVEASPDVVLMDLKLPGMDGVTLCQRLKTVCAKARVLMVTMHDDAENVARAIKAGAAGYLIKNEAFTKAVEAIETLYRGRRYYPTSVQERLIERTIEVEPAQQRLQKLSDREFELLRLVASGRTGVECAEIMDVKTSTVSTFRSRILEKLELKSTGELIRFAVEQGIVG
ncbi:MAG: response regulator [Gammaproteobacteria bacterium]|jgi:DNA-binding NarL/FixJ family response regulator|nr:response regulator [Gammaproteobacteria bacterium]